MTLGNVSASIKEDGSIEVAYNDGDDIHEFECTYHFDKANAEKLLLQLKEKSSGELVEMITTLFGKHLNDPAFQKFCDDNHIIYERKIWSY